MIDKHLLYNEYQRKILNHVQKLSPIIPDSWAFASYINVAGMFAVGWTDNNEVIVVTYDGYSIYDPLNGRYVLKNTERGSYHLMSRDNLQFYIPERKKEYSVWGLYGGGGNCVASSGWKLQLMYPAWPNAVVGVQYPKELSTSNDKWENIDLLKLNYIDYIDLACGFSPSETIFLVGNGDGIETFSYIGK